MYFEIWTMHTDLNRSFPIKSESEIKNSEFSLFYKVNRVKSAEKQRIFDNFEAHVKKITRANKTL